MDDVVTSQVGTLLIPFGGAFKGKPAEGLTQTVLVHTSKNSMPVDLIIATLSGEPSTRGFQPSGEEMPLAIRLTGKFHTRVPGGQAASRTLPPREGQEEGRGEEGRRQGRAAPQGSRPQENSVVLVADVDMLSDGAAVEVQDVFGQRVVVPRNGNLAFAQGLVEQFSGDNALISLRSRASFSRPLTVIREMEARAQQQLSRQDQGARGQPEPDAGEAAGAAEVARAAPPSTILTAEQQAELENFRKKAVETRRDLKELRKNLRVETDTLEFWTKVVNIGLVPLLVALAGLVLALGRRRRMQHRQRRA